MHYLGSGQIEISGTSAKYHWFSAEIISGTPAPLESGFDAVDYMSVAELTRRGDISANLREYVAGHTKGLNPAKLA